MKTMLEILEEECLLPHTPNKGVYTYKFTKHPYHTDFQELLSPYRDKSIKLIEIGADHGASTIMWDRYFPHGDITVLDTDNADRSIKNIEGRVDHSRTRVLKQNAYDLDYIAIIPDSSIDIVIDDGPHDKDSQLNCVKYYYPKLKEGGILIIEDIPKAEWFSEMAALVPEEKSKSIEYQHAASDSRLFICWK